MFYLKHSINLTNAEIICFSFYFHADFLVHYPENQQTHGSPLGHFYAKISQLWIKLLKLYQKAEPLRAFVLDSTETVRTAQEKHQTQASSTVALGRTLIASQILAANEKRKYQANG